MTKSEPYNQLKGEHTPGPGQGVPIPPDYMSPGGPEYAADANTDYEQESEPRIPPESDSLAQFDEENDEWVIVPKAGTPEGDNLAAEKPVPKPSSKEAADKITAKVQASKDPKEEV